MAHHIIVYIVPAFFALLFFNPLVIAQSDSDHFVAVESHPYGPGDREFTARVKLLPGENTGNIEIWVLYSNDKGLLTGAQIGSAIPQGKTKFGMVDANAVVTISFIFPHTDYPKPNLVDMNQRNFPSGSTVFYKLIKKKGAIQFHSQIVEFTMPDKLTIVNFGDSYASGEGAPYSSGSKWDNEQCHRSGNSGKARAVKQYKKDHPETAIAFKNVACSGAGVKEGITQSQLRGVFLGFQLRARPLEPQVTQVNTWLSQNGYEQLNIALISIGINEIGFAEAVQNFFILPGDIVATGSQAERANIQNNINQLSDDYTHLKTVFDNQFDYDRVLVSEYPDPTRWKDGEFCGQPKGVLDYGVCWGPFESTSTKVEFDYAYNSVLVAMNNKIRSLVQTYPKWEYVAGAAAKARLHGLCNCADPYFNTIGASFLVQGDESGTFHPNRRGHNEFKSVELEALSKVISNLQKEYKIERAKDIAREKALTKARLARTRGLPIALVSRPSTLPAQLPPNILLQAKETAKGFTVPPGDDNRIGDDSER